MISKIKEYMEKRKRMKKFKYYTLPKASEKSFQFDVIISMKER